MSGVRLDLYVLRRFLSFYGLALLYLVGLFLLVDVVTRLDKFLDAREELAASGRGVAGAVLQFYAAGLPLIVLQVAPFITVMGACMAVVDLRRWNELYPMMEAGRSLPRILAPVILFSTVLTGVLVVAQDRLAPAAVRSRLEVERATEEGGSAAVTRVPHLRDGQGNVWGFGDWNPVTAEARGVRVVPFRYDGVDYDLLEVGVLRWRRGERGAPGGWYPEGGTLLATARRPGGAGDVLAVPADRPVPTDLTPADVELMRTSEDLQGLSTARLRRLRDRYPELHYLTVLLHRRVTFPLANLVLLLVGAPLVLRGEGSSVFLSVLAALAICASYFVLDSIACDLAGRGAFPTGLATWTATILFGAAGVTLMDAVRGGPSR